MKPLNSGKYDLLKRIKTDKRRAVKGQYKVAVKVVDIFGNDTMKIIEVSV